VSAVRVERSGPSGIVAHVVLARPEVHNALDAGTIDALRGHVRALGTEDAATLRCVVLRGDGPSFCAGADAGWMRAAGALPREQNEADAMAMSEMLDAIDRCPVPVIARVHGAALGAGTGLCAVSDLVLAEAGTRFGFTETRLGVLPAVIAPFVVARIGETHARALFPGGRRFDAARALRIGLVHEIVEGEDGLDRAVLAAVGDVLAAGPTAARAAKAIVREIRGLPHESTRWHTARRMAAQRGSAEGQEGLRAFLEKRPPAWVRADDGEDPGRPAG
jgi:methylglutaconyl-CoA hydratase